MSLQILITSDNSHTLYNDILNETYHSVNGAMDESMHVYINNGFNESIKNRSSVSVFEMGFGTGLNAVLTFIEAEKNNIHCTYHTIETFPLDTGLISQLNYKSTIENKFHFAFDMLHDSKWNEEMQISENFRFMKIHGSFENYDPLSTYDLAYFDAFAPDKQPELWTEEIFRKLFNHMNDDGILVTYSAKGEVRRNLQRAGFTVERLEGPKGKREMMRCRKQQQII